MVKNNNFQTLSDLKKNFTTTTTATYANSVGGHTTDPAYLVFSFGGFGGNKWLEYILIRHRYSTI